MNLQRAIHLSRRRRAAHKAEVAAIRRLQKPSAARIKKDDIDAEIAEAQRLANRLLATKPKARRKHDRHLAKARKLSDRRFQQLLRAAVRAWRKSRSLR